MAEGRSQLGGITPKAAKGQTQRWQPLLPHLQRVNAAARRSGQTRFTALLHHVDVAALERAFKRQRRAASPGVDGVTMEEYAQDLQANLERLHARVHSGQYWPKPVLRAYIPKPDGGQRGLGLPALEDKLVQGGVAEVLNAIYETDFYGFSYGFRPGRSPHMALESLERALMTQRVNWVLDFDIRSFFDAVDHQHLARMLEQRIGDRRILRLIRRWLKAGILESGEWVEVDIGTPQGSGISPLLANVFLHYVFDAWVQQWRQKHARGQIVVIRYADDGLIGAQYEDDAKKLLEALKERLAEFGLELNESKTRLTEFGRFAAQSRAKAGVRRPETFSFLGFTHYCGETRNGKFMVKRRTQATRMVRKLKELRVEMRKRWHVPVPEQYAWLCRVLRGHYGYYGLIGNYGPMNQFCRLVRHIWLKALKRRNQKHKLNWDKFRCLLTIYPLPKPTIHQPWHSAAG